MVEEGYWNAEYLSSPIAHSMLRSQVAIVTTIVVAALAASCGGGGDSSDRLVLTPISADILPVIVSSDLAVGENRFTLGLINQTDQSEVLGAKLHLRFFQLNGQEATLKFEADPAALRITKTYVHIHPDGTYHTHEAGETGIYVATVNFDAAGQWGAEVAGEANGRNLEPVRPVFDVLDKSPIPGIGDAAPKSVQLILKDVNDIREIDTSEVPIAEEHNMTIADAVTSGRATVITFATPAFCVSRICGPTKQLVDDLYKSYGGQANFIHVEPYDLDKARNGEGLDPLPWISQDWHIETEPWVFIVDRDGIIAAEFEGAASYEELEAALKQVL
jgi:hypothetical protein